MTEQEWLACTDPRPMLEFLRDKASDRKLRLLAVACCRRIWQFVSDERCKVDVEKAEWFADELKDYEELQSAFIATDGVAVAAIKDAEKSGRREAYSAFHAAAAAHATVYLDSWRASLGAAHFAALAPAGNMPGDPPDDPAVVAERSAQCVLLRDIFGNPFRPITLDPTWLTTTVKTLAQSIYDERAFDRLPILADALEEAGCTDTDILSHCRSKGPHVRGCWVVDLILGKQ